MDIISHGLWGAGVAKAVNAGKGTSFKAWRAFVWGIFPDFFAFALTFGVLFSRSIFGSLPLNRFRPEEVFQNDFWLSVLPNHLYNISHSLIIFLAVFFIIWAVTKKAQLEMLAWLLHIFMDLPTHTRDFYPTPIFWPISDFTFSGIPWSNPVIFIPNIIGIIALFLFARIYKIKKI